MAQCEGNILSKEERYAGENSPVTLSFENLGLSALALVISSVLH